LLSSPPPEGFSGAADEVAAGGSLEVELGIGLDEVVGMLEVVDDEVDVELEIVLLVFCSKNWAPPGTLAIEVETMGGGATNEGLEEPRTT
jgi:hypothetical protein